MAIERFRIDDRLVHGQVVVGWGQPLSLGFIVLVDDVVADNDWERELYRMGTPPEMELFVETVESAAARMAEFELRPDAGMLLTGDIATMDRLTAAVPAIRTITIGGIHHRQGRSACLSYVFLSESEIAELTVIAARGVSIVAQDLPVSNEVPLDDLLRGRTG
ncbi:MAG: PTS sugar transporter subunit IIB [Gemmatimonadetes bacterium]|nr:PTS sugar transporter subunit IIB [Gemmatimonadota bacterium]